MTNSVNDPLLRGAGSMSAFPDEVSTNRAYDRIKRCFDAAAAFSAMLLIIPVMVFIVSALLILQGRPIFISQRRVGRDGKMFSCLKFRTMVVEAEIVLQKYLESNETVRKEWEATRKLIDDPRVTFFGRALRKSSIDELPQLLNVILGDMSLVGPRPIVEAEIPYYGANICKYYRVRPGLTGLWQVSGRNDVSYQSRVLLDITYVEKRSFLGDLKIIGRTIPAVIKSRGCY